MAAVKNLKMLLGEIADLVAGMPPEALFRSNEAGGGASLDQYRKAVEACYKMRDALELMGFTHYERPEGKEDTALED